MNCTSSYHCKSLDADHYTTSACVPACLETTDQARLHDKQLAFQYCPPTYLEIMVWMSYVVGAMPDGIPSLNASINPSTTCPTANCLSTGQWSGDVTVIHVPVALSRARNLCVASLTLLRSACCTCEQIDTNVAVRFKCADTRATGGGDEQQPCSQLVVTQAANSGFCCRSRRQRLVTLFATRPKGRLTLCTVAVLLYRYAIAEDGGRCTKYWSSRSHLAVRLSVRTQHQAK